MPLICCEDPPLPSVFASSHDSLFSIGENPNADSLHFLEWEHDAALDIKPDIGPSESWNEFYQSLREGTSIQEISLPDQNEVIDAVIPLVDGERKRYQRFREKKFICDECDRCFTLKQNVQQHLLLYHMNGGKKLKTKRGKRFKCLKCDQVFKSLDLAQRHDATKHAQKTAGGHRVFKCEDCNKYFPSSSALKEHISILHLKERPFECEQCGLKFGRKGGLRRHSQMVHEKHLFKCPFEGCQHPGYKCSKALTAHIRSVHTKDRPYKCILCERTFVRKNDLRTHEMTHQRVSSHKCIFCGKGFKRTPGLRAHRKRCKLRNVKKEEEDEEEKIKSEEATSVNENMEKENDWKMRVKEEPPDE